MTVSERERATLLVIERLAVGRGHIPPERDVAVGHPQRCQLVAFTAVLADHVDQPGPAIVDGRAGDAERIEVAARLLADWHWRADPGVPQHLAAGPPQPVDHI